MNSKISPIFLVVTFLTVLSLTGCQTPKPAALSDAQLGQVTESILKAINAGTYPDFVRDFSDQMKAAFPESEFTKLHELLQNASGNYISHAAPTLLNNQGFAVYRFPCKFEKEAVIVTITFKVDGVQVEGLFFDSTKLRKLSQ